MNHFNRFLIVSSILFVTILTNQPATEAMWLFQGQDVNNLPQQQQSQVFDQNLDRQTPEVSQSQQQQIIKQPQQQVVLEGSPEYQTNSGTKLPGSTLGSSILSIAGIQPSRIASLLNTVGETGFAYFNIQDQCRNRAACDLGHMLYRKLSFVHNWLIRTSVRTLTDMNNLYTQSWMEGMLGRNCTTVYATCHQSPLDGLMSMSYLQHFAS